MQQFKTFLQKVFGVLIPLSTPIVLLLILLTSRAVTEVIVALVLIFGLGFYGMVHNRLTLFEVARMLWQL